MREKSVIKANSAWLSAFRLIGWFGLISISVVSAVFADKPAGVLTVTPTNGLVSSGFIGGPFTPAFQVYVLTNSGTATLSWSAFRSQSWVTLSPTNGSLPVGAAASVTVSINSAANNLVVGNDFDSVTFTNLTNGNGTTSRSVALTIKSIPDHFSISTIPTPQTSGIPFSVTITARDATNGIITVYTNSVALSMTSDELPASLTPMTSGGFAAGQWTGSLTINALTLSHVTITASDGVGHTLQSNPFDVFRPPTNVLIPAAGAVDMVEDASRGLLYISAGSQVLRYDLFGGSFLSPYLFTGSTLEGLDISPSNNTLVVADGNYTSNLWIWVVDLPSGTIQKAEFPLANYELGTWSVAFGNDGAVLFTSGFEGSGFTPLRRYDPVTKQMTEIMPDLNQYSMLRSSGDRKTIGIAESNDSCGPGLRYDVASQMLTAGSCSGWYTDEIGVNRDGSQFAVPTSFGTAIFDGGLNRIGTIHGPVGVGYDPEADLVFFSWSGSTLLRTYETHTLTQVAQYDCGYTFSGAGGSTYQEGRVKSSDDGNNVFVTVSGGVRWISRGMAAPADLDVSVFGSPDPVDVGSNLTYTIAVGNNGPNAVSDATLLDLLPPSATFVSATASQGSYSLSNGVVSCALGALANGGVATVNVVVVQLSEAILTNLVAVTSSSADPNPNNNTTQSATVVQGIAVLGVSPGSSFSTTGPMGGPFTPSSQMYALTNSGTSLLVWSASSDQDWVSLSATNGTLPVGQSTTVAASVNSNANMLGIGSYQGIIAFANLTNGVGSTSRIADLIVYGVPFLSVTPASGLTSFGPVGGPFSPGGQQYTLTNTGNVALAWSATHSSPWVSLSAAGGTLTAGATTGVTATINSGANVLSSGYYFDAVAFANLSNGLGNTTRSMRVAVGPPPDHFTISVIASPQTSGVPFAVTISARDATNGIFTAFTNSVSLIATSSAGAIFLSPTNTGAFAAGQWSGPLTISSFTLASVTIGVDDGFGHTVLSNPFYVVRPASNIFIPATNRVDMVADSTRGLLYITAGNQVLRYDLTAGAFLSPFVFGTNLIGIDISPDNNTLVVADNVILTNALWVYVVDLPSGGIRQVQYPPGAGAGSWSVAFGNDNAALVSSVGQYLSPGPFLRFDPASNQYQTVANGAGTADMLSASGDGRTIGRAETHLDPGALDRYDVATRTVTVHSGTTEPFDIGVNRDGTQFATPTYFGMVVLDATLTPLAYLGTYASEGPLGVGYHPQADLVFLPWIPTTYLRVYETHTLAEVTRYDCGYSFGWAPNNSSFSAGRVRVSRDGNNVFVTVGNGVRWISQGVGLPADLALAQSVSPVPVGTGSYLTYTITATNGGPSAVANAQVLDRLPPDATFVSASVSQGTWSQSNGVVTAGLGALNAGGNATISVVVIPPQPTVLTNIAAIVSSGADPNPSNNVATAVTSVDAVGSLIVTPAVGLVSAGLIGGPFSPANQTYTLTNSGVLALNWSATNMTSWVSLSATGGTLAPGASTTVNVTINSNANSLAVGTYADTITFTNLTYGYGTTQRSVTLTVNLPANLGVTPGGGLNSTGPQTGPFAPASQNYTVSNTGSSTLNWSASNGNNWVTLSATSGSLSGGGSATVTVSINSNANNLWAGNYTDAVVFSNLVNGLGTTTRGVSLTVTPAAILAIMPGAGLTSSGFIGGPFSPASQVYSLTNSGSAGLSWSANNSQSWLSLSATSGTLGVGEGTTVTVSINPNGNALAVGSYSDTVVFTNLTNGTGSGVRGVSLTVRPPLDHFSFSAVASPQSAGVPIGVTITAWDSTNGIFTGFTGMVSLSGTSSVGVVSVSPTNSGLFSAGQWAGSVTVTNPATNIRLTAADASGHTGISNPFNVQIGPVHHFAWSTVPSPQSQDIPFAVAIAAQDAGNNTVTNFTGSVGLTASASGASSSVEDFESGVWPHAPWVLLGGSGTLSTSYAHDGNYGLRDPEWAYRTDVHLGNAGDQLSWWIRTPGSSGQAAGRAYLGFAASSTGAWSFVAAPNSGQIMIEQNLGYEFVNVVITSQTWQSNKWYKAVVNFTSPSSVQCSLYDSDGGTLLNSLTYTNKSSLAGGVAIRSFGGWALDTINSGSGTALAMTPTNSSNFSSGLWTGTVAVLQAATNVVLVASDGVGHTGMSTQFVVQGVGLLNVTPSSGLNAAGSVGGSFSPSAQLYMVTNTGMGNLSWSATNAASWLSLSFSGGMLSPGASTNLTVSLNGNASGLVPGSYADTVTFTNLSNGIGTTSRPVSLTINSLAWEQWQMQYFGCTNCPQAAAMADADGDGQSNWAEFLAGTDPTDSRSALRIVAIALLGTDTRVYFVSVDGKYYSLERCDFIGGPWTDIVTNIPGNAAVQWVKDTGGAGVPSAFYRIKLSQSTNAPPADSDGDGIPDVWTQQYFGHPTGQTNDHSCATCDADGTGQDNLFKYLAGLDPTNGASVFRIVSLIPLGNDLRIVWQTGGGRTNAVQASDNLGGGGNFNDLGPALMLPGSGDVITNYLDIGGATNSPSRFYRVRLVP